MRRIAATIAVATVVTTAAMAGGAPALAAHRATATTKTYYLSLGDSLAQGVQPNSSGVSVETNQGYPNQLFTALRIANPSLHLVKLGCPGETTATMMHGGICTYSLGSQLAQAKVFPKIQANLVTIMKTLTSADGSGPTPPFIGMTYYDPELANWLKGDAASIALAKASITLAQGFGNLLSTVYTNFGAKVADVFTAFHTTAFGARVTLPEFGKVPKDVAFICTYTWECAAPPVGPNIHANVLGYGVIANTFLTTYLG
jgi:lysophospholipase L1-like esterase